MTNPPKLSPRLLWQVARRPVWALGTARIGMPRMRLMDGYSTIKTALPSTQHIGYLLRTAPDWQYLRELRDLWQGSIVVKGVLEGEDAARIKAEGIDAVWVSNHAGRQFDAAPASIDCLPAVRQAVGADYPVIFDSGVESGLDVLRALALGADFVMLGRAPHFGLAALGPVGIAHVFNVLKADMLSCMAQMGVGRFSDLADRVIR
jgi:L-lactate dehydrogenase (cytochrome)